MPGLGFDSRRSGLASFLGLPDGWYDVSVLVQGGVVELVDIEVSSAPCDDCGFDTLDPEGSEWYAVTDAVWPAGVRFPNPRPCPPAGERWR